jgi:hypothetical protein
MSRLYSLRNDGRFLKAIIGTGIPDPGLLAWLRSGHPLACRPFYRPVSAPTTTRALVSSVRLSPQAHERLRRGSRGRATDYLNSYPPLYRFSVARVFPGRSDGLHGTDEDGGGRVPVDGRFTAGRGRGGGSAGELTPGRPAAGSHLAGHFWHMCQK